MSGGGLRAPVGAAILAAIGAFMLTAPGGARAQARNADTVLMSQSEQGRADQERYGYADAVIAGDLVFLSGLVAGRAPGEEDLRPAYERLFRHAERILARAGSSLADVVDMTSFHTDILAEIDALSEVQRRMLGSPPPAWTAIDVDRLLPDAGVTEIKLVARRSARPGAAAIR